MKAVTSKSSLLVLGLLLVITGSVLADTHYLPAKEHQEALSASTIIQHNNRLLANTSIGESIKQSKKIKAKQLYMQAQRLFDQASLALLEGQEEMAKNLAYKSIHLFYQSDKAHYGL